MPIPRGAPIEGWNGPGHDPDGGDRHVIALQQGTCKLYELYNAVRTTTGFRVSSSAIFDLMKTSLRPAGWTSADAAGLPIFPGLLRYDEAATGEIRHAIRFTVQRAQRAYVTPARHLGTQENPACLPYGARLRLRASFPEGPYRGPALAIIRALKRYGMIFADQGSAVYLSGPATPAGSRSSPPSTAPTRSAARTSRWSGCRRSRGTGSRPARRRAPADDCRRVQAT